MQSQRPSKLKKSSGYVRAASRLKEPQNKASGRWIPLPRDFTASNFSELLEQATRVSCGNVPKILNKGDNYLMITAGKR